MTPYLGSDAVQSGVLKVVGLDLSLTSTGVSDGFRDAAIQFPKLRGEERMDAIVCELFKWCLNADLAVVEAPAYMAAAKNQGTHHELAGQHWAVRLMLHRWKVPFALVNVTTLKMFTTGKGNASKDEMVAAVDAQYGTDFARVKISHGRKDMVDARALAAMGYDHVDQRLDSNRHALAPLSARFKATTSVQWPDLPSDN